MKIRHLILAFIAVIVPPGFGWQAQTQEPDLTEFFHALAEVESNHNDDAIGDGGASIGRYQIQHAYWYDATEFSGLGGRYHDVKRADYAEKVMREYWKRYHREAYYARDYEVLARIHNGGPKGHKKKATLPYWKKVQDAMGKD